MDYSFNGEIAQKYGVDEAVFLHNLYWWIAKNEANGRHHHDGKSWTYNTVNAFTQLFPFWSDKQVRRIIEKLRNSGAIYIGNYNEKPFDRTQWFALSEDVTRVYEKGTSICPNGQMEVPKRANGFAQTGTPIPDNKPDSKPDIYTHTTRARGVVQFYGDLFAIVSRVCPELVKRQQSEIDAGRTQSVGAIEAVLSEVELTEEGCEKLFAHVSKTYIVRPKYKSCNIEWVLNHIAQVWDIPEDSGEKSSGKEDVVDRIARL